MNDYTLDLARVVAQRRMSATLLTGIHHAEMSTYVDAVCGDLVLALNGYVLTEAAGEAASDYVTALLPLRPRWLPGWLWRRIPTRSVRWTLTARPMFRYPNAGVAVPALGKPVRVVDTDFSVPVDVAWRDA